MVLSSIKNVILDVISSESTLGMSTIKPSDVGFNFIPGLYSAVFAYVNAVRFWSFSLYSILISYSVFSSKSSILIIPSVISYVLPFTFAFTSSKLFAYWVLFNLSVTDEGVVSFMLTPGSFTTKNKPLNTSLCDFSVVAESQLPLTTSNVPESVR